MRIIFSIFLFFDPIRSCWISYERVRCVDLEFKVKPEVKSLVREIEILVPVDASNHADSKNIYFGIFIVHSLREKGEKPQIIHAESSSFLSYAWMEYSRVWY